MNGAQLWMGSVPKELDADAISTAFVTLGAPRPTAVALRRSTYRVSGGASGDAPVGFALVDFASAEDASIALETCADATFKAKARGSRDASTSDAPEEDAAVECSETTTHTFHLRRAADTLRKRVVDVVQTRGRRRHRRESNPRRREPRRAARAPRLGRTPREVTRVGRRRSRTKTSDDGETKAAAGWRDCGWSSGCARRTANRSVGETPTGKTRTTGIEPATIRRETRDAGSGPRLTRRRSRSPFLRARLKMMRCLTELGSETTVPGTKAHRRWPRSAAPDRAGVIASDRYLSLTTVSGSKRHRRKLERYRWVWDECKALLASVAGNAAANAFDGLAVTHGVRGSPHVDSMDVAPQFACSLGDFRATERSDGVGGCLCVETSFDAVTAIDTRNAIVSIDGRKVHWVDPRYVGDRWSVVWYRRGLVGGTAEPEPVVDGGVVPRWWAREGRRAAGFTSTRSIRRWVIRRWVIRATTGTG